MRRLTAFLILLAIGLFASGGADAATRRVALVIGNSAYENTAALKNPANDARDMAATLKRLGFEVIEGFDLDQAAMRSKIRTFSSAIEGASVALFYYAGHGLQVDGNNLLAPVNAKLEKEGDLDFETISLNLVLRQMEREPRTNLVFLDACRDNPLARRLARSLKTRSSSGIASGLARVESGVGMLIGYSTSPGEVALDGRGRNSPYTSALLKHVETQGQDISNMMIAVRQDVIEASGGKQIPWENSSLTGQFYFNPAPAKVAAATPEPAKPASSIDFDKERFIATAYQATVAIGTCGAYRIFEEQHRGTFYARLAEEWLRTNCTDAAPKRAVAVEKAPDTPTEAKAADTPASAAPAAVKAPEATPPAPAKTEVAAVEPSKLPAASEPPAKPEPVLEGAELVVALQKNLDRVGCEPGPIDGDWGNRSQRALEKFSRFAKLDLTTDTPSTTALAALENKTDRVCPLECGPQFVIDGDQCVKKVCGSGQILTNDGACIARPQPKKAPVVVQTQTQPRATRRKSPAVARPGDKFWGGEDTRLLCESGREFSSDCFPRR